MFRPILFRFTRRCALLRSGGRRPTGRQVGERESTQPSTAAAIRLSVESAPVGDTGGGARTLCAEGGCEERMATYLGGGCDGGSPMNRRALSALASDSGNTHLHRRNTRRAPGRCVPSCACDGAPPPKPFAGRSARWIVRAEVREREESRTREP